MSLKITHNGFELNYSDNEDKWTCWTLRMEDKSLAKLKQKVNKFISNRLKTANLMVGVSDTYSPPERRQVVSRDAASGKYWVMRDDKRRELIEAGRLFPWTAETDATLAEYNRLREEANVYLRQASELLKKFKKGSTDEVAQMLAELAKAPEDE